MQLTALDLARAADQVAQLAHAAVDNRLSDIACLHHAMSEYDRAARAWRYSGEQR